MKILKPLKLVITVFCLPLVAVLIASCSNESKLANHIPKDANVVVAFDIKSMSLKSLDFKQMLSFESIKKALGNLGQSDTTAAGKLENSGIDFLNKAYFFGKKTDTAEYGAAIAALSDAKKFEEFVKQSDNNIVVTQEGDFKIASAEGDEMVIGWNDTEAIILFGAQNPKETMTFLANLKKEESLSANSETFSDLEKEAADVSLWISFEEFQKLIPQYTMSASPVNLSETFLTATCNFEDGQVVVNSKYISNEELTKKFSFIKSNVSNDVASVLPGKSVIAMLGFALDMDKLYAYMEQENLIEPYDASATQMTGLSVKDFFTMLTGDVAVTVNGVEMKDVEAMNWATGEVVTRKEPQPDYCAVIGIADKEKASQLLAKFAESGMLTKNENYYSFQDKVFVVEKNGSLVIAGTEATKQFAIDGNGEKLNSELSGMLTGNATSLYFNLGNLPESVWSTGDQSIANSVKNSELEDIVMTGSTVSNNVTTGKIIIRFKQKNENSLVTISRISKKISEEWMRPIPVQGEEVVAIP